MAFTLDRRSLMGAAMGSFIGAFFGTLIVSLSEGSPLMLYTTAATKPVIVSSYVQTRQAIRASEPLMASYDLNPAGPETRARLETSGSYGLPLAAMAAIGGAVYALNAAILSMYNRRTLSMVATTAEKDEETGFNRRQALLGASAIAGMAAASPANAFSVFGFGEDPNQVYAADTKQMLDQIKSVLVLDANDPSKPERVTTLRRDMNAWVAKYRRDPRFSGRASYGNLYSVINAIAGHYTNFGTKTAIPKKRATQIVTEIAAAEQLLSKGR